MISIIRSISAIISDLWMSVISMASRNHSGISMGIYAALRIPSVSGGPSDRMRER